MLNLIRARRRALSMLLPTLLALAVAAVVPMYPDDALGLRCRIAPGADLTADPSTYTWIDVTQDLYLSDEIHFKRGGEDEAQEGSSDSAFTLRDNAGRYVSDNAESDLWPNFDLNCPIRWDANPGDGGGWRQRCIQYLSEVDDEWPSMTPHLKLARVGADGMFRRLGQGGIVGSPLRRAYQRSDAVGAWPLEDGVRADLVASSLPGGASATILGDVKLDGVAGPPGSAPLPDLSSVLARQIAAPVSMSNTGSWSVDFVWQSEQGDDGSDFSGHTPVGWSTPGGTYRRFTVVVGSQAGGGVIEVSAYPAAGGDPVSVFGIIDPGATFGFYDEVWRHARITAAQSGGNIDFQIFIDGVNVDSALLAGTLAPLTEISTPGEFTDGVGGASDGLSSVGHLGVFDSDTPSLSVSEATDAMRAHAGEMAHARIARVCTAEGVPYSVTASSSVAMGPQPVARLLGILRDCESTDHGILDDSQGVVAYRALSELYNQSPQFTVDGSKRELFAPFAPVRDDQKRRNTVKASRPGGGSAVYVDSVDVALVGAYEGTAGPNVESDDRLIDHAALVVRLGTVPGKRYPTLTLDLLNAPGLIGAWLTTELGDITRLANPPRQHAKGDVTLMLRGWTETILGRQWAVTANTIRADPYSVFVIEGAGNAGRIDSRTLTLAVAAEPADVTLSVTAAGVLATTTATFPLDFPIDLEIAGEQVRCTSIVGASSPQAFTVQRSVNGVRKKLPAGSAVRLWKPSGVAL